MPPRIDLQTYGRIGLVEFSSNAKGRLNTFASRDFLQSVQAAQPGIPVLELGGQDRVLETIGHTTIDSDAVRAIGKKFGVDAVIVGSLEVTEVKPRIDVKQSLSLEVQADVEAELTARLMEAESGATLWTRSSSAAESVASAGVHRGGVHFGASDPEATYGTLVHGLVRHLTQDFRPYWVKQ